MPRSVGVEIEFAGLEFAEASAAVGRWLGADPEVVSPHEHEFKADAGAYRLEVDFGLLKRLSRDEFEAEDEDRLRQLAVDALDAVAGLVTPLELVTPPLPEPELDRLEKLQRELEAAGAVGTGHSLIGAYGLHFNPEADLKHESIAAHLQAFLCLFDWLEARDETDFSRQLTPFIDPFSRDYEREVIDADFEPTRDQLIDHYLEHNPTRNRALDLLPLFAEIDADRVARVVDDERIKARPTYHYRLPNSRLGESDWGILQPWQDWLEVERLAAEPERLAEACRLRVEHLDKGALLRRGSDWIEQCQRIVAAR